MKKNGFTLIELIITLSIIALLSTLIIPNMGNIQNKAKETSLKNTCHTIQVALESYYLSNNSYPEGSSAHISAIIDILTTSNDLNQTPKNPYTKSEFNSSDTAGLIYYTYDNELYTITGYGADTETAITTITGP